MLFLVALVAFGLGLVVAGTIWRGIHTEGWRGHVRCRECAPAVSSPPEPTV